MGRTTCPRIRPRFNRLVEATLTSALLFFCLPPAAAQSAPPATMAPKPDLPAPTVIDNSSIITAMKDAHGFERDQGQQSWRILKSKDYDKLPPEFQWDTAPVPVIAPFPVYPYEQLKAGVAGKVRIFFIVGPAGRVVRAELDEAATPEFGLAVRAMIDACRFSPAKKKDGTLAYAYVGIEYNFRPKGRSDAPISEEARWILRDLEKSPKNIATLKDLDQPLKPLSRQPPVYPTALKEAGRDGDAEIEFFVDRNGAAQLPRILSSSAPEFGYAAAQAVAAWRFEVPRKAAKPVAVRARIPIDFSLPAGKPANRK